MVYIIIIAVLVALDQLVKYAVSQGMSLGDSIPVIQDVFHITSVHNYGAAFSSLQGQRVILIVLTLALIAVCAVYLWRHRKNRSKIMLTAIAAIIAGGIGNLIDRLSRGYVVDMFDFRVFPVFNVADICVTLGCVALCVYLIFFEGRSRKKRKN